MRSAYVLCMVMCALIGLPWSSRSQDTDGDGLTDFQEIHKYATDPRKVSTAGDGVSDGDWERRREFTYTIRSVIKVMDPVDLPSLNDDYQDARVRSRGKNFVELEVIHYPLNTVADAITSNPRWREENAALKMFVAPGITTNWDEGMQRDLKLALKADGIDPDSLDDKELVERVARWLLGRSKYTNMFCTHYVQFPEGRAAIYPGLEAKFESDKGNRSWTVQEQFDHELFGRSMFATRSHGTCTSTAVYLTTVLRALGIPTRMVLALPLVDATDDAQVTMVRDNLHHHSVRRTVLLGLAGAGGYANHTFNEVYIGGRWVRLNATKLGQNTLDRDTFGLLTHVNTFRDLSDVPLAATWGRRYALGERDDTFRYSNPYKAEDVSDHFGKFAHIENPEVREHRSLTLTRAYWKNSAETPSFITDFAADPQDRRGQVLVHVDEWFADESYGQYKIFTQNAAHDFTFAAEGKPTVRGQFAGTFTSPPHVHEIGIVIQRSEYDKMEPDIEYTLVCPKGRAGYQWVTKGTVTLRKGR